MLDEILRIQSLDAVFTRSEVAVHEYPDNVRIFLCDANRFGAGGGFEESASPHLIHEILKQNLLVTFVVDLQYFFHNGYDIVVC